MINPIQQTSKGYTVSGCSESYNPITNNYDKISGRVRVVKDNPFFDEMAMWDLQHRAINHDYGDLVVKRGSKGETVTGFNMLRDLR